MKCRRCLSWFDDEVSDDEAARPPRDAGLCEPCVEERAAPVPWLNVAETFGPGGPLAAGNPAYEARPGQVSLAREVADALGAGTFGKRHHLLAEGPCGIGKSKAYGVPAAWLAAHGKKVLIVTASIALQEQLIKKDLPALQAELGWDFDFAILKGRSNYLCKAELETLSPNDAPLAERDAFDEVLEWSKVTRAGDKSELLIKPSELVWGRFSVSSEACPGSKCSKYSSCFAMKAREAAATAGILVTNYHMLFLNLAYGGSVLPASDVVILDEAHEAPDIARDLLGFQVSAGTFRRYARDADKRGYPKLARALRSEADAFFTTLLRFHDSGHYRGLVRWPLPFGAEPLAEAVEAYTKACTKSHLAEHALTSTRRLKEGLDLTDENCVYSIDVTENRATGERRAQLRARYVQPGPVLEQQLWGAYASVVAVSATITTDGKFDFARRELGAPKASRELIVETPFDFARQAMLVVPDARELPEPNDPSFVETSTRYLLDTIRACGGRTLALFTSYRALNAVYERIVAELARWPAATRPRVLRQGDAPPSVLAETFKADVRSVLLGTSSFWTGIDVPGEALTGLVIERLPFGSPDDPVTIRLGESDRNSFGTFTVPKAILQMRQGIGRLIRSQADSGAVVLLDRRVTTKSYGARFLRSLPPMRRASSPAAISPFLRSLGVPA